MAAKKMLKRHFHAEKTHLILIRGIRKRIAKNTDWCGDVCASGGHDDDPDASSSSFSELGD